ncbi:hypothetical protein [Aporhodopirellula aestuarii]|uniref:Uncharacterized protein n=1 Tax=Aporhodopirellula aestuarii TaxID=2950107 RepID=A0ABT0U0L2_9BACT|nr:hypothetical protein [Aporhodopirellula aestuarii]MCM2370380.1 hypothetical protein [Aporhodopirellula aestuarii]
MTLKHQKRVPRLDYATQQGGCWDDGPPVHLQGQAVAEDENIPVSSSTVGGIMSTFASAYRRVDEVSA